MKISHIHSYLIHPEKGSKNPSTIHGAYIPQTGDMFKMIQSIYMNAPKECKYDIAFSTEDDKPQENCCRRLIIDYMKTPDLDTGRELAKKLQAVTTKRSGLGLFFIIFGYKNALKRIVISRFPADNGILAEEDHSRLSVVFIERIFLKNAHAYKSAIYEGESFDTGFWTGKAIDKQINTDLTISDYWIKEFLVSDFSVSGERGTRTMALAIKDAVNSTKDLTIKKELIASALLLQGFDKKVISMSEFADFHGLSDMSKDALKKVVHRAQYFENFLFLKEEFEKHLRFKTIELDNGAMLSADVNVFDKVFQRKTMEKNVESFITSGVVIDEKIRKSKQ